MGVCDGDPSCVGNLNRWRLKRVAFAELHNHRKPCGGFFKRLAHVAQARDGSWLGARTYECLFGSLAAHALTAERVG